MREGWQDLTRSRQAHSQSPGATAGFFPFIIRYRFSLRPFGRYNSAYSSLFPPSPLNQNCWQKDPAHRMEISDIVLLLEDNSCMITPSLDPPAASVQMEGSLEPVAPQKLKAHREKAIQQQTRGDDKTICTVRPEETVPHQAAALFGMEHVARNQVSGCRAPAAFMDRKFWTETEIDSAFIRLRRNCYPWEPRRLVIGKIGL